MIRALLCILLLGSSLAHAQAHATRLVLILPFENQSKAPGLEWVSESFPEVLGQALSKSRLFVVSRNERQYAFDRLGIPTGIQLSRATLLTIAQEMDVDYIVTGNYNYDGRGLSSRAQVMDVNRLRLSNPVAESGAITQTVEIESALTNGIAREIERLGGPPAIAAPASSMRLDALENYIKGQTAGSAADRIRYFREAVRLSPNNSRAMLALGRSYFDVKDYVQATNWLSRIPKTDATASEAQFFIGLAAYDQGNYQAAEDAFRFTAQQLPLIEVFNNLGVVSARRGKKDAVEQFERAVNADQRDPDYHFNFAVSLLRSGDSARAARELKESVSLRPQDVEAKTLLQSLSTGGSPSRLPAERVKRNYDESSYRQLALEIQNVNEMRFATLPPAQHAASHVARGNELLMQGSLDLAEIEFREASSLDPANALAHAGLAEILESRNEIASARQEANTANRLALSASAFLTLARIENKQQNRAGAIDYLQRALKIDPNNAQAIEMLRQLGANPQR